VCSPGWSGARCQVCEDSHAAGEYAVSFSGRTMTCAIAKSKGFCSFKEVSDVCRKTCLACPAAGAGGGGGGNALGRHGSEWTAFGAISFRKTAGKSGGEYAARITLPSTKADGAWSKARLQISLGGVEIYRSGSCCVDMADSIVRPTGLYGLGPLPLRGNCRHALCAPGALFTGRFGVLPSTLYQRPSAMLCTASGPGVEGGFRVAEPAPFVVSLMDKQRMRLGRGGNIVVSAMGAAQMKACSFSSLDKCTTGADNRDGTYSFQYSSVVAGNITLDVRLFGEVSIAGFPRTVAVAPGATNASHSFLLEAPVYFTEQQNISNVTDNTTRLANVRRLAPARRSVAAAGKQYSLTVLSRDRFDNLQVASFGPEDEYLATIRGANGTTALVVVASRRVEGRGDTYIMQTVLKIAGSYTVNVTLVDPQTRARTLVSGANRTDSSGVPGSFALQVTAGKLHGPGTTFSNGSALTLLAGDATFFVATPRDKHGNRVVLRSELDAIVVSVDELGDYSKGEYIPWRRFNYSMVDGPAEPPHAACARCLLRFTVRETRANSYRVQLRINGGALPRLSVRVLPDSPSHLYSSYTPSARPLAGAALRVAMILRDKYRNLSPLLVTQLPVAIRVSLVHNASDSDARLFPGLPGAPRFSGSLIMMMMKSNATLDSLPGSRSAFLSFSALPMAAGRYELAVSFRGKRLRCARENGPQSLEILRIAAPSVVSARFGKSGAKMVRKRFVHSNVKFLNPQTYFSCQCSCCHASPLTRVTSGDQVLTTNEQGAAARPRGWLQEADSESGAETFGSHRARARHLLRRPLDRLLRRVHQQVVVPVRGRVLSPYLRQGHAVGNPAQALRWQVRPHLRILRSRVRAHQRDSAAADREGARRWRRLLRLDGRQHARGQLWRSDGGGRGRHDGALQRHRRRVRLRAVRSRGHPHQRGEFGRAERPAADLGARAAAAAHGAARGAHPRWRVRWAQGTMPVWYMC